MLSVVDLNSPAHLFGLAERTVAVESLYVKSFFMVSPVCYGCVMFSSVG